MTQLVLLPGMMCDVGLFGPQIDALSGKPAVTVSDITGADTMQALAARVLASAPDRFALVGLSVREIVAMEMLRQSPERIAGLALMDTNPLAERDEIRMRRAPQIDKIRAGGLAAVMRDKMKPNYLTDGPGRRTILDLCMAMALDLGPDVFVGQSVTLRDRPDQRGRLRDCGLTGLVLCGREDALCPLTAMT